MDYYAWLKPFLFLLSPEDAHDLTHWALKQRLVPAPKLVRYPRLECGIWGRALQHPVGLAAGFDKNAELIHPLFQQGFAFVEVGTITPEPQSGNPRPRLFRLEADEAVINRFGFNSKGGGHATVQLETARTMPRPGLIGVNIGKNKTTQDAEVDYVVLLQQMYLLADYITVNISSPNTPGLRDLQAEDALKQLLGRIQAERAALQQRHQHSVPVALKLSPDMDDESLAAAVQTAKEFGIDGLIVSNTTISRPADLRSMHREQQGGLSGRPLKELSTRAIRQAYRLTGGQMPIIGVGGIGSGRDAYEKIKAGASLVQLYSSLVYQGFGVVQRVLKELDALLAADGYASVRQAVGADHSTRDGTAHALPPQDPAAPQ